MYERVFRKLDEKKKKEKDEASSSSDSSSEDEESRVIDKTDLRNNWIQQQIYLKCQE